MRPIHVTVLTALPVHRRRPPRSMSPSRSPGTPKMSLPTPVAPHSPPRRRSSTHRPTIIRVCRTSLPTGVRHRVANLGFPQATRLGPRRPGRINSVRSMATTPFGSFDDVAPSGTVLSGTLTLGEARSGLPPYPCCWPTAPGLQPSPGRLAVRIGCQLVGREYDRLRLHFVRLVPHVRARRGQIRGSPSPAWTGPIDGTPASRWQHGQPRHFFTTTLTCRATRLRPPTTCMDSVTAIRPTVGKTEQTLTDNLIGPERLSDRPGAVGVIADGGAGSMFLLARRRRMCRMVGRRR